MGWGNVFGQEDSLDFDHYYQALFDTVQTEDDFLGSINAFVDKMENMRCDSSLLDSTSNWHRGQTYYRVQYIGTDLLTFRSTTWFNDNRHAPLYVNQLVYKDKVIYREDEGGYNKAWDENIQLSFLADSVINPEADKKDHLVVPRSALEIPAMRYTFYNFELGVKVVFSGNHQLSRDPGVYASQRIEHTFGEGYRERFRSISEVKFYPITEEDSPYVFIENN